MAKHRRFNADRFIAKLQGHEAVLRAFLRLWPGELDVDIDSLDLAKFREFVANGTGRAVGEVHEQLARVYDLCRPEGQFHLLAACEAFSGYRPDPKGELHVEVLSLKVRTEHEEAFNLAYDRYNMEQAERFAEFRGKTAKPIDDPAAAAKRLHAALEALFLGDKQSDNVIVRQYSEGERTNFIVYHEQRVRAELIFKGKKTHRRIAPEIFRPAQQDFISYNSATGRVEIETRYEKEEKSIRKKFAECCLGDAEFFEEDQASVCLDLSKIGTPSFAAKVDDGDAAALIGLRFRIHQQPRPSFIVRSKDVLKTLELYGLRGQLAISDIEWAAFKLTFRGDKRGKRVELGGTNSIRFKRVTREDDVLRYLKRWEVLIA